MPVMKIVRSCLSNLRRSRLWVLVIALGTSLALCRTSIILALRQQDTDHPYADVRVNREPSNNHHDHEKKVSKDTLAARDPLFGKAVKGTNHVILNNAVHGCGSDEFVTLIDIALKKNGPMSVIFFPDDLTDSSLEADTRITSIVDELIPPVLFSGHFHFTPSLLGGSSRVMFSIIRDPFELAVSAYENIHRGPAQVSFDQCVLMNRGECYQQNQLVKWFCGYEEFCAEVSKKTLDRAKWNVDKFFVVVGIVEEFEDTVRIVERLLPDMTRGLSTLSLHVQTIEDIFRRKKYSFPPEVERRVKAALAFDYKFYHYVRNKFQRLKSTLNINATRTRDGRT